MVSRSGADSDSAASVTAGTRVKARRYHVARRGRAGREDIGEFSSARQVKRRGRGEKPRLNACYTPGCTIPQTPDLLDPSRPGRDAAFHRRGSLRETAFYFEN
jgi:hypothetical protein